jgi:hypothetical protein
LTLAHTERALWTPFDSPASLRLFHRSTKAFGVQLVDSVLHQGCDHLRSFSVHDGIFALRVQQNLIQALLHGVCAHELRSLCGDRLFKSALRSLMIWCKHVILLNRVACQAFGGVLSTVGRRFFTIQNLGFLPPSKLAETLGAYVAWASLYIHSG